MPPRRPAQKLDDLTSFANIVKVNYGKFLNSLTYLFATSYGKNRYYIFQEFQAIPIKRLVYNQSDETLSFTGSWSSREHVKSMVLDANGDEIAVWKHLTDRSRPINAPINNIGGHDAGWRSTNRQVDYQFKTGKKKKPAETKKYDSFVEIKIEALQRVAFYKWGFEVFSPSISMIAIRSKVMFPYALEKDGEVLNTTDSRPTVGSSQKNREHSTVEWSGYGFTVDTHNNGLLQHNLMSYWQRPTSTEPDEFDLELNELLVYEEQDRDIPNIGQRRVNLDI